MFRDVLDRLAMMFGGGFGVGLVLIFLPSVALYYGMEHMGKTPYIGLPILAIFGIMILFGALSLVSTLFCKLQISDPTEALAMPRGSIRAVIALSLVVLFAIISIMLYQSIAEPYVVRDLSFADKNAFTQEPANRIIGIESRCPAQADGNQCTDEQRIYTLHLLEPRAQESADLAKQLLVLIGTLMTAVTSFYFADRSGEIHRAERIAAALNSVVVGTKVDPEAELDGCDVPIVEVTPDEDLPAARGGVAS